MNHDRDEQDFRADELVRMAAVVMEPMHGKDVPPPRVTAAELIRMAQRQGRTTVRVPWRWLSAPALVGAIVLMVLGVANFLPVVERRNGGPSRVEPAEPRPLPLRYAASAPPARARLLALAGVVAAAADTPGTGRYTYVHTRTWSRDATACRDERLWWAPDGSGREVITDLAGSCADAPDPVDPGAVSDYGPGELKVVIPAPSADPPLLATQLAEHEDFGSGPQAVLRAVCALYRYHALDAAHRTAALRVLAESTGLAYRGTVVDGDGRTGIAVTADSNGGGTRDVAVFDPGDGRLLAYERVLLRSPARATLDVPALGDSVLFLTAGRTDRPG